MTAENVANQRLRSIPRLSLYELFASAGSQYSCSRPSGRPSSSQKLVRAFPDAGLSLWRVVLWTFGHDSAPANGATRMLAWRSVSLLLPPQLVGNGSDSWQQVVSIRSDQPWRGMIGQIGWRWQAENTADWAWFWGHSFRWMRVGASVSAHPWRSSSSSVLTKSSSANILAKEAAPQSV